MSFLRSATRVAGDGALAFLVAAGVSAGSMAGLVGPLLLGMWLGERDHQRWRTKLYLRHKVTVRIDSVETWSETCGGLINRVVLPPEVVEAIRKARQPCVSLEVEPAE